MEEIDVRIGQFLQQGLSLRKVAEQVDIPYVTCRCRAIKHGLIQPKLKKVKDGKAVCNQCHQNKEISKFPNLRTCGTYLCSDCLVENNHKYQIAKVGCTPEKYEELLELQNNKCAICHRDFGHTTNQGRKAKLAVDHDHSSGKIRGLLCGSCNRGLGYLGEKNLQKAMVYCKKC